MLRPRRSALYVPGDHERALAKSSTLPADVVIFDWEDAVAPESKSAARRRVVDALTRGGPRRCETAIRVNPRDTPWHADDLCAAVEAHPSAILLPKVNAPDDVRELERSLLDAAAPTDIALWAMIETPAAVLRAWEIAAASTRLTALVMGTNDLAKELQAAPIPGRQPLLYCLSACVAAARAAGRWILDGVYNDLQDDTGLEAECRQGRQLGFDGKTLIHPRQLAPCNRVFAPSDEEIVQARRMIGAWDEARAQGHGVATLDGRLIENLHVEQARRTLALAEAVTRIQ